MLLLAVGCGRAVDENQGKKAGPIGGPPTTDLKGVVVGVVGNGVLLENHSREELTYVEIVINEGGPEGGFRFSPGTVPPNAIKTYLTHVFRDKQGRSLNPSQVAVRNFAIYADTPRGRGAWRGSYRNQH